MPAPLLIAGKLASPLVKRALWAAGTVAVIGLSRTKWGRELVSDLKDGVDGLKGGVKGICDDINRDIGPKLKNTKCSPYDQHAKKK